MLVSRYKLVLEELSRAQMEVEALKLLVEKLYADYTALPWNYTSILEAYNALKSEFQRVVVELAAAEENLTRLARDYNAMYWLS